jgi:hypothetical protein
MSARLVPEEDLWNTGWAGRPAASDIREPDVERPCWPAAICTELLRFMADDGIGIADTLLFTGPNVYEAR